MPNKTISIHEWSGRNVLDESFQECMELDRLIRINRQLYIHSNKLQEIWKSNQEVTSRIVLCTFNYNNESAEERHTMEQQMQNLGTKLQIVFEPCFKSVSDVFTCLKTFELVHRTYFKQIDLFMAYKIIELTKKCAAKNISLDGNFLDFVGNFLRKSHIDVATGRPDRVNALRPKNETELDLMASIHFILDRYLLQSKLKRVFKNSKSGELKLIGDLDSIINLQLSKGNKSELIWSMCSYYRKCAREVFPLNAKAKVPFVTGRLATYHFIKHRYFLGRPMSAEEYFGLIDEAFTEIGNVQPKYSQDGCKLIYYCRKRILVGIFVKNLLDNNFYTASLHYNKKQVN